MVKTLYEPFICMILLFVSCSQTKNEIIETSLQDYTTDSNEALTLKESRQKGMMLLKKVKANTVGKEMPRIEILSLSGEIKNLKDVIKPTTIIIASNTHCAWGFEGLTRDFPEALNKFKKKYKNRHLQVICLLIRDQKDKENLTDFNKTLEEIIPYYNSLFIIDENEANKINVFANPTRLYIDDRMIVTNYALGVNLEKDHLYKEMVNNLMHKK